VAFLQEFRDAGFSETITLRTYRNARTKNPAVVAVDVHAKR